jgi:hypothetical protein
MGKLGFKALKISIFSSQWVFKLMLWLLLVCASLLFTPKPLLTKLSLDTFSSAYGHFIGLGLIIAAAYFFSRLINLWLDEAIAHLSKKRATETIEAKVKLLDPAERALLREFFLQGATILTLPMNELAVKSLVDSFILESLGNERHYAIQGPTADYKISMNARIYLNREVLRLPAGEPSQAEMQHLIKARPSFIGNLVQQRKHAA